MHSAGSQFYQKFSAALYFRLQPVSASNMDLTKQLQIIHISVSSCVSFFAGNIVLGLLPGASFVQTPNAVSWLVAIDPGLTFRNLASYI